MYNCHLAWWSGAIQRMLFSNIHWKVLYPVEKEEAWNFKTSFKRRQWHLLVWINQGIIDKARQDLEKNIRSSDKSEYTIEAEAYMSHRYKIFTTRRAWRHTSTKSDRRLNIECWPVATNNRPWLIIIPFKIESLKKDYLNAAQLGNHGTSQADDNGAVSTRILQEIYS